MSKQISKNVVCDISKCTGCRACELACFAEHNRDNNQVGDTVGTVEVPVAPRLYVTRVSADICAPVLCKHCEDAACLNACSNNAIKRIDGQIIIDSSKCMGCKDCMLACPFGAIDLQDVYYEKRPKQTMEKDGILKAASKCDLCRENPEGPACVRACPNDALHLIDALELKKKKNVQAIMTMYETAKAQKEGGNDGVY